MNRMITMIAFVFTAITLAQSQIVITEIMYNPPESGGDSLEYIEIYNQSEAAVNLDGYAFVSGINHTFSMMELEADAYLVLSIDSVALRSVMGVASLQWAAGALNNSGELIRLADADGNIVDSLEYGTTSPWPLFSDGAAGGGASIELCIDQEDNADGANWMAATTGSGVTINSAEVKGTPGTANSAVCTVPPAATVIATSNVFTPSDVTINIGEKVLWRNEQGFHNVNGSIATFPQNPEGFGNGAASSAPWEYEFTFTQEGVYNYQCDPHASLGMNGTVTVINDIPQLVITEIMYNDPSSDDVDSLEFIEIYNNGDDVFLGDVTLTTNVINFTLPDMTLPAGDFLIVSKFETAFFAQSDVMTVAFQNGGLGNNSDSVTLKSQNGSIIDQVIYMDGDEWPEEGDGQGSSISLCDITADNNIGSNWQASSTITEREYEEGMFIFANPGALNACLISIADASEVDENGTAVNDGQNVILDGIVYGVNLRPGGLQFTVIDDENEGIAVFSASDDLGYEVNEGDEVRLMGEIGQFNGLTQIYADSVELLSTNNNLIAADTVTTLGEATESSLVTLKDVVLLDPSEWTGSGSGFNVSVSNGSDTFQLRIDADVEDLYDGAYPTGVFNVTGIGGQFDNSEPYLDGYQLLPRYAADIEPYVPFVEAYPLVDIADVIEEDDMGNAISEGEQVEIIGVTHGTNFRPSGLQFTIIDDTGDGIGLFSSDNPFEYSYAEGDLISIKGTISQFNGLTQINPDSINVISSGIELQDPLVVEVLGEETESKYIKIESAKIIDPSQWAGDGSSFNVQIETASGAIFDMRIDSDTELSDQPLPGTTVMITGIGGQFDNSEPYFEGYQILPSFEGDVVMVSDVKDTYLDGQSLRIFPNPVQDYLMIDTELKLKSISIYNAEGRRLEFVTQPSPRINMAQLAPGTYIAHFIAEEGVVIKEFIKL
ncbi:lamin tail domain-containing protein [Portibacter marinus]|uniref:lamin tail domain-containing protein n=1 Tax=Portibacter marinus TaxID=2898660 RepID=UPI001F22768E|nr:lamin tail domain-containing protein [Portibacter marinus]